MKVVTVLMAKMVAFNSIAICLVIKPLGKKLNELLIRVNSLAHHLAPF